MIKKVSSAMIIITFLSSLNARDLDKAERFIGLEVGASTIQANTGGIYGELNVKGTDAVYGLRLGAQNQDWRTILALNYYDNTDSDQNYETALVGFDYYLLTSQFNTTSFRPYLGVHGGYMNYESTMKESDGFFYGGQAGFTVDIADTVDVDIAYRYSLGDVDEVDSIGSFILGLNYLY